MFKKFLTIILIISSFTLCTTGVCFADVSCSSIRDNNNHNVGPKTLMCPGINDAFNDGSFPGEYDFLVYFDKDTIKSTCPNKAGADAINTKIKDIMKTGLEKLKNKDPKLLTSIGALGIGTAVLAGGTALGAAEIGRNFYIKDNAGKGPFEKPTKDVDFCTRLWNVFGEAQDCGVIFVGQQNLWKKAMNTFFDNALILSQKEN